MKPVRAVYPIVALVLAVASGCDVLDPEPYTPQAVVESYQVAGEELQPVRLTWTAPIDEPYDPEKQAISEASVRIERLGQGGKVEQNFPYRESEQRPGYYLAEEPGTIRPGDTYRLVVELSDRSETITSETVVPDTFDVAEGMDERVRYGDEKAHLAVSRSRYPERGAAYVFEIAAQDPRSEMLTPSAQALGEGDATTAPEELQETVSQVFLEEDLSSASEDLVEIPFDWEALSFYGPNQVRLAALDDNYYDFLRTQSVQQGGLGFAPGEIPNVLTHVEGGTGLFGSYARVEFEVDVEPSQ